RNTQERMTAILETLHSSNQLLTIRTPDGVALRAELADENKKLKSLWEQQKDMARKYGCELLEDGSVRDLETGEMHYEGDEEPKYRVDEDEADDYEVDEDDFDFKDFYPVEDDEEE